MVNTTGATGENDWGTGLAAAGSGPFLRLVLVCVLLLVASLSRADDEAGLEDGCVKIATYSDDPQLAPLILGLERLYQSVGQCVTFQAVPLMRAHGLQLGGWIDGQLGRTAFWLEKHGNEVQVIRPAILKLDASLASLPSAPPVTEVKQLAQRLVGHRRDVVWGGVWLDRIGARAVPLDNFRNVEPLFASGRLDHVLTVHLPGLLAPPLVEAGLRFQKVSTVELFHVLSRDEAALAARLSRTLDRLGGADFIARGVLADAATDADGG